MNKKMDFDTLVNSVIISLPQMAKDADRGEPWLSMAIKRIQREIKLAPDDRDGILQRYRAEVNKTIETSLLTDDLKLNYNEVERRMLVYLDLKNSGIKHALDDIPKDFLDSPGLYASSILGYTAYSKRLIDYCNYHLQHNEAGLGLATKKAKTECDVIAKQLEGKGFIPRGDGAKFISIFFPDGRPFEKVTWLKSRKDCFSLMMEMNDPDIKPKVINKYINQAGIDPKTKKVNTKPLRSQDKQNCTAFLKRLK